MRRLPQEDGSHEAVAGDGDRHHRMIEPCSTTNTRDTKANAITGRRGGRCRQHWRKLWSAGPAGSSLLTFVPRSIMLLFIPSRHQPNASSHAEEALTLGLGPRISGRCVFTLLLAPDGILNPFVASRPSARFPSTSRSPPASGKNSSRPSLTLSNPGGLTSEQQRPRCLCPRQCPPAPRAAWQAPGLCLGEAGRPGQEAR